MDTSREEPRMTEPEDTPASPGELLRRRRESVGHSLENAAEATKISKTYLRALEENRFHELPSPAYLKGFLRIYANYLKLDADELAAMIARDTVSESSVIAEPTPEKPALPLLHHAQRFALPLVLLAALIISAVIMQPGSQEPQHKTGIQPQQPVPQAQPVPQQALQAASSSSQAQTAATAPAAPATEPALPPQQRPEESVTPPPPPPPSQQPASGFVVRMKVLKNGTLIATIDDSVSQNYQLTAGDLIEWKAATSLALDVSDTGGVELELNGKPVKHQAVPGKSAHLVLGAEGLQL